MLLCRHCPGTMVLRDDSREVPCGDSVRVISASRFWMECENVACQARGPKRFSESQAAAAYLEVREGAK